MTPQLYVKLVDQITRQAAELDDYELQIITKNIAVLNAQPAVDAAQTLFDATQAALTEAQAIEYADVTAEQEAVDAAQVALEAAKSTHRGYESERDALQSQANALSEAMAQCQAAIDAGGLVMTDANIAAQRLAAARETAWERIKAKRDAKKAGGVLVAGNWFHSDADSRIQQLGLLIMGANVPPVAWKTMSGEFVTMTPTLAGQIFQATAASDMAVFKVAEAHRSAVNVSTDPANYDIGTGWPATFTG